MSDRRLPVIALLLAVVASGCLAGPGSAPEAHAGTTPVETVTACQNGIERLDAGVTEAELPDRDARFAIDADRTTVTRGDTLKVTLRNVADEPRGTGTERMFVLQRHVDGEWTTVLGAPEGRTGWNATLVMHEHDKGYTWRVGLREDGFSEWGYEPCGSLLPGEYRFVYHGLVETGESEGEVPDPSIAVEFRIRE